MKRNGKKTVCLTALALIVAVALSSCDSSVNKSSFVYYISAEPATLDPQTANDPEGFLVVKNTFTGLFTTDQNGEVVFGAAKSFFSENFVYEFQLREGQKWSDGRALTAFDFEFAFQRIFDANTGSPHRGEYAFIKNGDKIIAGELPPEKIGVHAKDNTTLIIELDRSDSAFFEKLSRPQVSPCNKEFFESTGGRYGLEVSKLIYNGNFSAVSWQHGHSIGLRRRSDADSSRVPASVSLFIEPNKTVQKQYFDNGNSSLYLSGEFDKSSSFAGFETLEIENTTFFIAFNEKSKLFCNQNVRLALASSFKRESFQAALPSRLRSSESLFPASVSGETRFLGGIPFNPDEGRQKMLTGLEELGLERFPALDIICLENTSHKELLAFASQVWQKELNVFIGIQELSAAEFDLRITSGSFDAAVMSVSLPSPSPEAALRPFAGGEFGNPVRSDFESALSSAASQNDPEKSIELFGLAEDILLKNADVIPVYVEKKYLYLQKKVHGIVFLPYYSVVDFSFAKN